MLYAPPYRRQKQRHDWAQQVEEAVRQVGESGHTQHGGLCHAAGVPWHKHRCHSGRVLGGAAQEPVLIAKFSVHITEHVGIKHYANKLIASGEIEQQATTHS